MKTVFFETTSFTATVGDYLTDDEYRQLQTEMQANPEAGDVMPRTGGFRKLCWQDTRRGKGKRGGLRVIITGCSMTASFGCFRFMTRMRWRT